MLSRNTTMPESKISENKLLIVCINAVGELFSPLGIIIHSYRPYLIRNAVFRIPPSAIQHC